MRIRDSVFTGIMALAVMLGLDCQVLGSTVTINAYSGYRSGSGGEFNITSADVLLNPISLGYSSLAIVNGGFETFCLEYNEHASAGSTYNFGLSYAAVPGGPGSVGSGTPGDPFRDYISVGTAWLYSQFAHGELAGYDYNTANSARQNSAAALQKTIWWLENENYSLGASPDPGNIFSAAVLNQFGSLTGARVDALGQYGVSVLNMGDAATNYKYQDQLILTPSASGVASTPDRGGSLVLLGLALSGLVWFRRLA